MNLDYLKTLLLVAEYKSLTEAAVRLEISQPAVTKQIKVLEEKLKVRLLERGRKQLELTEAGLLLELYGQQLLKIWEQARLDLFRLQLSSSPGQLQLFCPGLKLSLCQWLESMIQRAFPGLRMAVLSESSSTNLDKRFLLSGAEIEGLAGYRKELVYQDKLVLLASKELAISNLRHVQVSELSRYQLFTLAEDFPYRQLLMQNKIRFRQVVYLPALPSIIQAVARGLGLALVSKRGLPVNPDLPLQEIDVSGFNGQYRLWLFYPEVESETGEALTWLLRSGGIQREMTCIFAKVEMDINKP